MSKQRRMGGPVALRERTLKDGRKSLYLDVYADGNRTYEFLKLYLLPGNGRAEREHNRETMRVANAVAAQRTLELQNDRYGFGMRSKMTLLEYYEKCFAERRTAMADNTARTWERARDLLAAHGAGEQPLRTLRGEWLSGFADALRREGLKDSAAQEYLHKLHCCLRRAAEADLVPLRLLSSFPRLRPEAAERSYLTLAELQRLTATPCRNAEVRAAFLFSCLTGLRKSDINALRWGDVTEQDGMCRITFRQRKTRGQEYLDISEQAVRYMGERKADGEAIFHVPHQPSDVIGPWVRAAGITKHITFHSARHTFATLMLSLDVDIYTVSKLLGHANVKTTQVYARVLDKGKRAAVRKIPKIE